MCVHVLIEFRAKDVNQLKVVLDKDNVNSLTLCISFIPTLPT
jgi:hypothetical protein